MHKCRLAGTALTDNGSGRARRYLEAYTSQRLEAADFLALFAIHPGNVPDFYHKTSIALAVRFTEYNSSSASFAVMDSIGQFYKDSRSLVFSGFEPYPTLVLLNDRPG